MKYGENDLTSTSQPTIMTIIAGYSSLFNSVNDQEKIGKKMSYIYPVEQKEQIKMLLDNGI